MAGFTESAMLKKLEDLNSSQQSIQTLSLWLIHHRKHHAAVVKVWFKELIKVKDNKQLTFMYLANDVIQNSKKKGPEYGKEFGIVLKKAFEHMSLTGIDEKTKGSLHRILNIWGERGVYDASQIDEFKLAIEPADVRDSQKLKKRKHSTDSSKEASQEKEKKPKESDKNHDKSHNKSHDKSHDKKTKNGIGGSDEMKPSKRETKVEVDGLIETHITLSPKTPPGDPPEPEELIKALIELENSASSDAAVRERIASLPPEVSEIQLLTKLQSKESAQELSVMVNSAVDLLQEYNARLASELAARKKLASSLRDFAQTQTDLAVQAEQRLEEYSEKLQKIYAVRAEVKSHIENLPDVSQLPDVTGGLAPLPSAGDLFNVH